jgi:hypothetical protein
MGTAAVSRRSGLTLQMKTLSTTQKKRKKAKRRRRRMHHSMRVPRWAWCLLWR